MMYSSICDISIIYLFTCLHLICMINPAIYTSPKESYAPMVNLGRTGGMKKNICQSTWLSGNNM